MDLTHDGITQSLEDWAADYGIPVWTIRERLRRGWSVERAITEPMQVGPGAKLERDYLRDTRKAPKTVASTARPGRAPLMIEFNGRTLTVDEWASHLGMRPTAIKKRLKAGWTVERALTTPRIESTGRDNAGAKRFTANGESLTLAQWSERLGLTYAALRLRLQRGSSLEQLLAQKLAHGASLYPAARLFTVKGESLTLAQWSERMNLPIRNIRGRLRLGWDTEEAILTPAFTPRPSQRFEAPKISQH